MSAVWHARLLDDVPLSGSAPEYAFRCATWRSSQWLWVEFTRDDGTAWNASFECGQISKWRGVTPVATTPDQFVVLAGGAGYWVSAAIHALSFAMDDYRISHVLSAEAAPKVVAAADGSIHVLSATGVEFARQVANDWVRLTEARGAEVFGVAEDSDGDGPSFAVNVNSYVVRWV